MKTFEMRQEDIRRQWYLMDASNQIVGRLANRIAQILQGKNKASFTPHSNGGDYVVVTNCQKLRMSGKKEETKKYYHHSLYLGGLKAKTFHQVQETNPSRILRHAVVGMLPKTKIGKRMITRLKIYKDDKHPHACQQPVVLTK